MTDNDTDGEFLSLDELVKEARFKLNLLARDYLIGGTETEPMMLKSSFDEWLSLWHSGCSPFAMRSPCQLNLSSPRFCGFSLHPMRRFSAFEEHGE